MIADGRVALDGKVLDTPATLLTSLNGVTVDGRPVKAPAPARLFVYHKPQGLLVTERDPKGRPTIYDKLPDDLPRVVPVGRLDLNTEGLLLLTTDGGLKRQLELPSSGVERIYRARAYGQVSQEQLEDLIEGVEIDGVRYGQIDANLERRTGANVWVELRLSEGKNREVRRVLEHLGLKVSRLIRLAYGPFVLGDLPVGQVAEIRQHDIIAFRKALSGGKRDLELGITGTAPRERRERSRTDDGEAAPEQRPARPRPGGKPRSEGKSRLEGKSSRPERKPRTDGKPRTERETRADAKPRGGGKPRSEGKPRADGKARANAKPRTDGKPRGDATPRTDASPQRKAGAAPRSRAPSGRSRRSDATARPKGPRKGPRT